MAVIKVGILHSLQGTMAASESPLVDAAVMAIDEINEQGGVLGHEVKPIIEDGASRPLVFEERTRKLLSEDKVTTLFGCWTSASRKAVKPLVEAAGALLWYPVQYEGLEESPNIVYTGSCLNQQIEPAVNWMLQKGKRRCLLIGSDYVFPRTANLFIAGMVEESGGTLLADRYVPLGRQDFSSMVEEIGSLRPHVIFNTLNGDSNYAFFRQLYKAGIGAEEVPVMSFSIAEGEQQAIATEGEGHFACWSYFQTLDTPENRAFIKRYQHRLGSDRHSSDPIVRAYSQVWLWRNAVEATGSFNPHDLIKSLPGQHYMSPAGEIRIEKNHHLKNPALIGCARKDGLFDVIWRSKAPIEPKPWFGVEELPPAAKPMIKEVLRQFPQSVHYASTLEDEIIERKMAKEELAKTQAFLEAALEKTPAGIAIAAMPDGRLIMANSAALGIPGGSRDSLMDIPIEDYSDKWKIYHGDGSPYDPAQLPLARAILHGESSRDEFIIRRADGEERWVLAEATPILNDKGERTAAIVVFPDITEQKLVEKELELEIKDRKDVEDELRLYDKIIKNIGEGVYLVSKEDLTIRYANPKFLEIFGYEADEIIGKHVSIINDPSSEDPLKTALDIENALKEDGLWRGEVLNIRKDGSPFWCFVVISTLSHKKYGEVYVSIQSDISDRKKVETALQDSEKLLRSISENYPAYLSIIEKDFTVGYTSGREFFKRNLDPGDFIGLKLEDIFGEHATFLREQYEKTFAGEIVTFDLNINNELQHYYATPLYNEKGEVDRVLAVVENRTERKLIEDTLYFVAQKGWEEGREVFLESLVEYLSKTLNVEYAFVDTLKNPQVAQTIALYAHGKLTTNIEYELKHTPCENVFGKKLCYYGRDIKTLFPLDEILHKMKAESYAGIPLWDSKNQPIGLIAVMGCGPLENRTLVETILQIVAVRAAAVLERKISGWELQKSEERFRLSLRNSNITVFTQDMDLKYTWVYNPAADFTPENVLGKTDFELIPAEDAESLMKLKQEVLHSGKGTEQIVPFTTGDKPSYFDTILEPLYDADGNIEGLTGVSTDITRKIMAEAALRESEEKYRRIFETMEDGYMLADMEGTILEVNPAAVKMLNYDDITELKGMNVARDIYAEPEERKKIKSRLIEEGTVKAYNLNFKQKDGVVIVTECNIHLIYNEENEPVALEGTFRDITERIREDKVQAAQLRLIEYASTHSVIELLRKFLDEVEELTGSNIGFYHFLADDQETILLQTWSTNTLENMCTAEGEGQHYPISEAGVWVDCVLKRRPVIHNDYDSLPHKRGLPEGHAPVIRELVVPVFRGKKIVAILGTGNKKSDYDEHDLKLVQQLADLAWETVVRKRTEEALRENQQLLANVFESMEEGVLVLNSEFKYTHFNRTLEEISHTQREDVLGKIPWEEYPFLKGLIEEAIKKAMQGDVSRNIELKYTLSGGKEGWTRESYFPLIDAEEKIAGVVGVIEDISERKQTEDELARYRDHLEELVEDRTIKLRAEITEREQVEKELKQAKKAAESANQAKSVFLANMSHELRTPLNAILGFSEMLVRESEATANEKEKLSIINRSGEHLLNMINDVLDLSKIEAGRIEVESEVIDLPLMLNDIGQMMEIRAESAGLRFRLTLDPLLARYVKTDSGKVRQILINLLGNAVAFTAEGEVSLRVRTMPAADDAKKATLQMEVEDSGPGIAPEEQERIFEPFVQAGPSPSSVKGSGLGLAITRSFVEVMGGEISVTSQPGEGSRFIVQMPVTLAEAAEAAEKEREKPAVLGLAPGQPPWRILVVEDNYDNRLLLCSLLLQTGFKVKEAENGKEAVKLFKKWEPHFIWMDMRMPVMDGYEATAGIRSLPGGDKVKIVAITASALKEQRKIILDAGCDEVVNKPIQRHKIFETMAEQLGLRYSYEEGKAAVVAEPAIVLTGEMMAALPAELRQALQEAAHKLDISATDEAIKRIAHKHPKIADGLQQLAGKFSFEKILELLKKGESL